jgi:hypothetical protein
MAKNDPKDQKTSHSPVDVAKYLRAAGFTDDDIKGFTTVGGLQPIVSAEVSFGHEPVIGWLVDVHDMPKRESLNKDKRMAGIKEDWRTYLFVLVHQTTALQGEDLLTVDKGKEVRVPENGNLKNNAELQAAAMDQEYIYPVALFVTGQLDTSEGKLNPMWNYEVKINWNLRVPRTSQAAYAHRKSPLALQASPVTTPQLAQNAAGANAAS